MVFPLRMATSAVITTYPGFCILDPHIQGIDAETAKDDAVYCADPGTGKHRDDLFGNERHVNAYTVALDMPSFFNPFAKRITSWWSLL